MKALRALVAILILLLMLTACSQQSGPTATPTNLNMSMRTEPERLTVGETTLIITLQDARGTPVDGASLQIQGDMDHEGMVSVDREVSESTNGEYRVPFEWMMGGGWIVMVTVQLPGNGGEIAETFDFFVEAVSSESVINRHSNMEMNAKATTEHPTMNVSEGE